VMNAEQLPTGDENPSPPSSGPKSPFRLWLERIGIALVAAISLLAPLLIGLLFYLALTDGLVINAGDPLHEARLWMVQERKGATGLGLTIASPQASNRDDIACAHTSVTFLKWDGSIRLESEAGYCRCYETRAGQLRDAEQIACQ
jgi:hypothetical protein